MKKLIPCLLITCALSAQAQTENDYVRDLAMLNASSMSIGTTADSDRSRSPAGRRAPMGRLEGYPFD